MGKRVAFSLLRSVLPRGHTLFYLVSVLTMAVLFFPVLFSFLQLRPCWYEITYTFLLMHLCKTCSRYELAEQFLGLRIYTCSTLQGNVRLFFQVDIRIYILITI